jgi:ADP-ribosylglycohydrolase
MLGAIAGDVIGSVHEFIRTKTKNFPLFVRHSTFTDDSVLTAAVAD